MSEEGKRLVFEELKKGEALRETNDLKMAASLITFGIPLVSVRSSKNERNGRTEFMFGFRANQHQKEAELAYLSKQLFIDASSVLDTRDKLISYISNGSVTILEAVVAANK